MRWIDITLPVSDEYPCWPGDEPFKHTVTAEIGKSGSVCNLSKLSMSTHFGTHIDAPLHFVENGRAVDELDLDILIGPCLVIEMQDDITLIKPCHLEGKVPPNTVRLLIKTVNSRIIHDSTFVRSFTALSAEAADLLISHGVKLLGLDYYSIAPYGKGRDTHVALLRGNDAAALEGVDLSQVEPGEYYLVCMPLKIRGASGAPARVLLGR